MSMQSNLEVDVLLWSLMTSYDHIGGPPPFALPIRRNDLVLQEKEILGTSDACRLTERMMKRRIQIS